MWTANPNVDPKARFGPGVGSSHTTKSHAASPRVGQAVHLGGGQSSGALALAAHPSLPLFLSGGAVRSPARYAAHKERPVYRQRP